MNSPTSTTAQTRTALKPQSRPGKLRVAQLMRAGAEVIAEHGFNAATMAAIAERANAPIGSLYRFFPNKDVLADALIRRYSELIADAFAKLDSSHEKTTTEVFANALLSLLTELRGETQVAVVALLDARLRPYARRKFHGVLLCHIVRALKLRDPRLGTRKADDMAIILLQNMKMLKSLSAEKNTGAIAELREMTRLYLTNRTESSTNARK
jgi:AcrR family transcriptional regulator